MISRRYFGVAIGIMLLGSASPVLADGQQKLVLTGSSTVAPMALEIAKLFERENPTVRVDVQTGGSSRGIADARSGLADIGMASRSLKESESDVQSHTIALDGVAPIVHGSNKVKTLSLAQFRGILTKQITNWKEVGGTDGAIIVANRAEGRSELELVAKLLKIKPSDIKADLIVGENAHGIKTVSRNPLAISYMSIGHTLREAQLGVAVRMPKLAGVPATIETVKNGRFPLARPLNFITKGAPEGLAKRFIDFARSTKVTKLVQDQSFIPNSI